MIKPLSERLITLVEGQVYLSVGGGLTEFDQTELMRQFDEEFTEIIEASPATFVHLISELQGLRSLPPLSETRKLKFPYHPRMGYNVTIGAFRDPMMRFIISLSISVSRTRYRDASTLAEACAFLAAKDSALPPPHTWNLPSNVDVPAS